MKVVVCGPESSGTRLLTRLVGNLPGVEAFHFSQPNGEEWWDWHTVATDRFVVITRRPDITVLSALEARCVATFGEHEEEWPRAIASLAAIPGAYWLCYEALVANPLQQLRNVAAWLGVEQPEALSEPVRDENAKWLATVLA